MKISLSVVRFLIESAFIVLIAAATAIAHLGKLWIALSVGGAWLVVAMVERTALEDSSALHSGRLRFLFPHERQPAPPAEAPVAEEHPPPPLPEPEEPVPEPAPPVPEPQPPTPEPGEPTPQLQAVQPLPPEPEAPESDGLHELAEPAVRLRVNQEPREWNIWELERVATESGRGDGARHEELAFLLLELRQFADAEGRLPLSFDPVVRESFGELVYSRN